MKHFFCILMVIALGMNNVSVAQQSKTLQTEKNGFKWYKICQGKYYGAESKDGKTLIPLSRKYTSLRFSPEKKIGGYFDVEDASYRRGICDINGKEIIPCFYNFLSAYFNSNKGIGFFQVLDMSNCTWGAYDYKGNLIIPCVYCDLAYFHPNGFFYNSTPHLPASQAKFLYIGVMLDKNGKPYGNGFNVLKGRHVPTKEAVKSNGSYTSISEIKNRDSKYYIVSKNGRYGLTNEDGIEIISCEMDALESAGIGFLKYKINGFWGVLDFAGKIIIPTDRGYTSIGSYVSLTKRFPYTMNGYKGECDVTGQQISKIKTDTPKQAVASSSSSSSSSSSNKSESSGNKTTTVVVEHHRGPIPVQEWQQCLACFGSGQCPDALCSGRGWYYSGDRVRTCIRCQGSGKCNMCAGRGGQNITVYR